jgi:hypothetical protein
MNFRNLILLGVCATLLALAGCDPKPQPPKAATVSQAVSGVPSSGFLKRSHDT